jgi:phage shock protein C
MRKVYLSKTDRKIFGVCGGIGETYDIDPNLLRLLFIFLTIVTAVIPVLLVYILAWAVFPEKP